CCRGEHIDQISQRRRPLDERVPLTRHSEGGYVDEQRERGGGTDREDRDRGPRIGSTPCDRNAGDTDREKEERVLVHGLDAQDRERSGGRNTRGRERSRRNTPQESHRQHDQHDAEAVRSNRVDRLNRPWGHPDQCEREKWWGAAATEQPARNPDR